MPRFPLKRINPDHATIWDECKRRHLDPLFEHCERNGCRLAYTPECWQMRRTVALELSNRDEAVAQPVQDVVLVNPSPHHRVLRSFTVRRDDTGEDQVEVRLIVRGERPPLREPLLSFHLGRSEISTLSVPINLSLNTAVVLENPAAPLYIDSIMIDDIDQGPRMIPEERLFPVGYFGFGVVGGEAPRPMSAPMNPTSIDVLRQQQGVLTPQEARARIEGRRNSFLETDPVTVPELVTTEEGRMKGLINSWPKRKRR